MNTLSSASRVKTKYFKEKTRILRKQSEVELEIMPEQAELFNMLRHHLSDTQETEFPWTQWSRRNETSLACSFFAPATLVCDGPV